MKRFVLPSILTLALAGSLAFAQQTEGRHHHAPDPHRAALHMSKKLNLTPDQTARVEPILADREQKVAALRANTALTPDQRHEQMHAIHQATEQQLAGVLSPDQLTQLKAMHHEHHGHDHQEHAATPGL